MTCSCVKHVQLTNVAPRWWCSTQVTQWVAGLPGCTTPWLTPWAAVVPAAIVSLSLWPIWTLTSQRTQAPILISARWPTACLPTMEKNWNDTDLICRDFEQEMTASVWFDFQEQKGSPSCPLDPAQVLRQCEVALGDQPPRFHRTFIRQSNGNAGAIRVMQWNILAQGKKRLLSDAIFTQILWLHVCTSDVGWAQTIHPNVTSTSQNYGMEELATDAASIVFIFVFRDRQLHKTKSGLKILHARMWEVWPRSHGNNQ